ncbi:C-type lectin BfL-2-like [Ruditapes philippinarum]|uniref:C-type lectin BfL-2-like n=1 Tax=Ruditapes philippinarum TaxID=129788 RepID=UPI00295B79BE|nr:C-type lectin BfL-2-like [Ruditapes philippinarum]
MGKNEFRRLICLVVLFVSFQSYDLKSVINDTAVGNIDGAYLLRMGKMLNKPDLSLIGAAMNNLHKCEQWTTWSACTASRPNHFGLKKRTRLCGTERQLTETGPTNAEEDFNVCKGVCPADYEITENGSCMKLYTITKSKADTQKQCEADGGNLVKIDTESKLNDVGKLTGISTLGLINIDGVRKNPNSAWVFATPTRSIFFNWKTGQPDNESNQLCIVVRGTDKLMWDADCLTKRYFICEIST